MNIVQTYEGELRVSSEIVAERTENQHKNVLELIRNYGDDLSAFGQVAFETRDGYQGHKVRVAHLNEQQATLLITYMRNSDVVRAFKLELVKQFYEMRQALESVQVPRTLPEALRAYAEEVEAHESAKAEIKALEPKRIFADAVAASNSTVLVGELAKIMRGNGIDVGQNRLFDWMRQEGYLIKRKGSDWNMPTQRSMDLELFQIKETAVTHSDGHVTISKTAKVTGKGQQYFVNLFLDGSAA